MQSTPPLPDWIRGFTHPGYTNIFEMRPTETKLFCTETLLGDWGGSVLLLAKDAAPVHVIQDRVDSGEVDPWRHGEKGRDPMGWRTNERTQELADCLPGSKLYGSALAHMMKNDEETSSALRDFNRGPLRDHLERVLRFVVDAMPNLRSIVCMGNEAWRLSTSVYAPQAASKAPLAQPVAAGAAGAAGRTLRLFRLYHPSRPFAGGWAARREEWAKVGDELRRQ